MLVCIGETYQYVLPVYTSMFSKTYWYVFPKHACMYFRNMPVCISNTCQHVLPADGRKQKQAGEGGAAEVQGAGGGANHGKGDAGMIRFLRWAAWWSRGRNYHDIFSI